MAGADPPLQRAEALTFAADRELRRSVATGAGSRHGESVWYFVSGPPPGSGPGARFSCRATAVPLLGDSGGHEGLQHERQLATVGSYSRGPLHPDSDVCVWRGADRGAVRTGFQLSFAAGVLWASRRCGAAAGAAVKGGGTRDRAHIAVNSLPRLSLCDGAVARGGVD